MKVQVIFPGYWAHGRIFEARPQVLLVTPAIGTVQGDRRKYEWATEATEEPGVESCACYLIKDEDGTEWGIPATRVRVLEPTT